MKKDGLSPLSFGGPSFVLGPDRPDTLLLRHEKAVAIHPVRQLQPAVTPS